MHVGDPDPGAERGANGLPGDHRPGPHTSGSSGIISLFSLPSHYYTLLLNINAIKEKNQSFVTDFFFS
jgi:hypothetical protein